MTTYSVCRPDELRVGEMKTFTAGRQKITLYHLSDGFFATQASCTHTFAPLSRGKLLQDSLVQCPMHRARFNVRSGEVVEWASFPPGIQLLNLLRAEKALRTFEVRVRGDQVQVDVQDD